MEDDDRRSFHLLETEIADEMVWLVKCPPRVAKAWRDLYESSSSSLNPVHVANYIVSVDLQQPDLQPELTMEMVGDDSWNIPKLYSLSKSKDIDPMDIFSEANQGEVAVEGAVAHKIDMSPHCGLEQYSKICREKNKKQVKKRRTRGDRSEVKVKISELFERQPKWTTKQIEQKIDEQASKFLKQIVKELCVYKAKGHAYELKPQYKKTGEEKHNRC